MSISTKIAKEIKKVFENRCKSIKVEIKHEKEVGEFVRKIEQAHKDASNGTTIFK